MKNLVFIVAAFFMIILAACSSDYGSGTSANSGVGPIVIPSDHKAPSFDEPEIESSSSEEGESSSSGETPASSETESSSSERV